MATMMEKVLDFKMTLAKDEEHEKESVCSPWGHASTISTIPSVRDLVKNSTTELFSDVHESSIYSRCQTMDDVLHVVLTTRTDAKEIDELLRNRSGVTENSQSGAESNTLSLDTSGTPRHPCQRGVVVSEVCGIFLDAVTPTNDEAQEKESVCSPRGHASTISTSASGRDLNSNSSKDSLSDVNEATIFSRCQTMDDVVRTTRTDAKEIDELLSKREVWQLWHTNNNEARQLLDASLCSGKKIEDANLTHGIHPIAYEGPLTARMEWLRDHQHELNSELKFASHHKVDEKFRESVSLTNSFLQSFIFDLGESGSIAAKEYKKGSEMWQLWNANFAAAQQVLEDSLCSEKKREDENHAPGIHPSAYESSLTPKMEWLRSVRHETNAELQRASREKSNQQFQDSLRCELPKERTPLKTRINGPLFRARSLSKTRPGSRLSVYPCDFDL